MRKTVDTFDEFMADETRVTPKERAIVEFESALITIMVEAREKKGLSQRALSEISGVHKSAIARLEKNNATLQIDTLFNILYPLGYTLDIVPIKEK